MRNARALLDLPLPQAIAMASTNLARVLGLGGRKGLIAPGYDADLILLDDQLMVSETWVGGQPRYSR